MLVEFLLLPKSKPLFLFLFLPLLLLLPFILILSSLLLTLFFSASCACVLCECPVFVLSYVEDPSATCMLIYPLKLFFFSVSLAIVHGQLPSITKLFYFFISFDSVIELELKKNGGCI